jgi:hypothetical protein
MWKRLSRTVLPAVLVAAGAAGCYTQMRPSAGAVDSYGYDGGYWADPYYAYLPYSHGWEMYPGLPWWYADYWRPWPHDHAPDSGWGSYEEASGRHGWDRGPGSPLPPRAGGSLGGGVGGSTTPTTPPPAQTSDEGDKKDAPRDTDRSSDRSSDRRSQDPDSEKKRSGWGR